MIIGLLVKAIGTVVLLGFAARGMIDTAREVVTWRQSYLSRLNPMPVVYR